MFVKVADIPKPFPTALQRLPDCSGIDKATEVRLGRPDINRSIRRLHKARPGTDCPSLRHRCRLSIAANAKPLGVSL